MQQEHENNKDKDNQTTSSTSATTTAVEETSVIPAYEQPENSGFGTCEPTNFLAKHPLQNRWTWWYDNPGKKTSQSSWGDHLKRIMTIDTVEDFWRLYNNIVKPSQLVAGSDYHLFKESIEPKWEDPANLKGGKWIVNIPNKNGRENLDKLWLWLVLACIGESFNDNENNEVCGCVVSVRKAQDRIALWTRNSANRDVALTIGRQFKAILEIPDSTVLGYQQHQDSQRNNSSYNNRAKYEV
jgi:translation initiation factor 4E